MARGSTCGVVSGGALGIALMRHESIGAGGENAQRAIMQEARAYVDWFHDNFSTQYCRERTGVDFYLASSWFKYLLPGERIARCFWHIGKAASYLQSSRAVPLSGCPGSASGARGEALHCASEVLRGVREATGVGHDLLEKTAFVLDGGVALSGGVCGAMAGAVMAVNLVFGWDIRHMSYPRTIKEFVAGHANLLRRDYRGRPETFAIGRGVVQRFLEKGSALECRRITGKDFSGWDDFQEHISSSESCRGLVADAVAAATEALKKS